MEPKTEDPAPQEAQDANSPQPETEQENKVEETTPP